jgi:hypothetical protein
MVTRRVHAFVAKGDATFILAGSSVPAMPERAATRGIVRSIASRILYFPLPDSNISDPCFGDHDEIAGVKFDVDTDRSATDKYGPEAQQACINNQGHLANP